MESAAIDAILQEKLEMERALLEVRDLLDRERDEKMQLNSLYQDQKAECERVKVERAHYQQRLMEEFSAKKDIEGQYEARIAEWRRAMEVKQRELEGISAKMVLPIDTDILRMRVTKDIEARFRLDIETKSLELEKMTEAYYECKRQLEIVKTTFESHKYESDKLLADLRDKHKTELSELFDENHALQLRLEESRDRDTIRQVRRDLDEYKKRYSDASMEQQELRKERDALKLAQNEMVIKQAKEMEDERNVRRGLQTECEKLKFRVKCLEDDL
jgi:hypothetical protein